MVCVSRGDIRVRVTGAGPHTVVFVCDMPVLIEHYDRLFTLLEPRYRIAEVLTDLGSHRDLLYVLR